MSELQIQKQSDYMVNILDKYATKLDSDQIQVIPLLGYGMPVAKAANYLGIQANRIYKWLKTDVIFITAIDDFKQAKNDFHQNMLNQAGVMAWDRVFEFLSKDAADGDERKIQADMSKFVIGQLSLKTNRTEIEHKVEPQLHVTEGSAGLIAQKLKDLDRKSGENDNDIVDAEYAVDEEIEEIQSGKSSIYEIHPECEYGKLEFNSRIQKWRCHKCGEWTADLVVHIRTNHKLSPARYRDMYGLDESVKFYLEKPREITDEEKKDFNKKWN